MSRTTAKSTATDPVVDKIVKKMYADADTCTECGSVSLFDACFDEEENAITADDNGEWRTVCNDCGTFQ